MVLLTALDVINAACARIGEEPVESLEEDLGGGQSASLIYEDIVDFNLGLQPSGFAFAREMRQLSKLDGATPLTGYKFVFDIPGPYTGLPVFLADDIRCPDQPFTDFILTNGQVHSDADPLFAMVKFRPDPHRWTATFRMATITALGGHLVYAIASDRNTKADFLQEAYGVPSDNFRGGQMRAALFEDAFANPPRRMAVYHNPLEQAWRS
jgi:hypothetical protein